MIIKTSDNFIHAVQRLDKTMGRNRADEWLSRILPDNDYSELIDAIDDKIQDYEYGIRKASNGIMNCEVVSVKKIGAKK